MIDCVQFTEMPENRPDRGSYVLVDQEQALIQQRPFSCELSKSIEETWTCPACNLVNESD